MAIEMKVPAVGESITEVTVATWNKKEGDHVKLDEVLCELESDKATFELPAEAEGVLHIVAKEGDVLPIGAVICTIEAGGATASVKVADAPAAAAVAAPAPAAAPAAPAVAPGPVSVLEIKVPAVGESITEVTVSVWNKKTGDSVSLDEVLCELESDKATFELPAEAAGVLEIVAESGTVVPIGGILARITVGGSVAAAPAPVAAAPSAPSAPASSGDASYAAGHPSPAAAKILDEMTTNLDVGLIVSNAGFGTSGNLLDSQIDIEKTLIDLNCRSLMELSYIYGQKFAKNLSIKTESLEVIITHLINAGVRNNSINSPYHKDK